MPFATLLIVFMLYIISLQSGEEQGCAAAKRLAALAGKVRLAVAGKFPIIPKGYSGRVEQLLAE